MKFLLLNLILLSFLFSSILAQGRSLEPQVDSLITRADAFVFESRKDVAKELYRSALKSSKNPTRVLEIEGKIALTDESWKDARSRLESLLKRDPKSVFGHYGLGICYREIGKQSIFLNRLRGVLLKTDWDESKEHFQFVLATDSSFSDVLFQYSLLLKCQGDYPRALEAARAQLRFSPEMLHAQVGLFKLYKSFVFNGTPQVVFEWLRGQLTEYATYFIGEAMRRAGMLDQAESLFLDLLKLRLDMPLQPLYLSLAKISYARDSVDLGESYYWRAVNEITTRLGLQIVFDEVKLLLTDAELETFASLRSLRDKGRFILSVWINRNPTPGSKINPRLTEHHKRFLQAETKEHYDGDRTYANNPDKLRQLQFPKAYWLNDEYNDKGLIYVRHGPPDQIQKYLGEEILNPTESWMYSSRPDAPEMIFHFTMEGGMSNNWRLVRFPPYAKAWEDLASWDPVFYRLSRAEPSEREILTDRISKQTQETVMAALSTDRHTWKEEKKTFPIPFSVDAFRSEGGRTLVDFSYAIPVVTLVKSIPDSINVFKAELGFSIVNQSQSTVQSELDTVSIPINRISPGAMMRLVRTYLRPDNYEISLFVKPLGTNLLGNVKASKKIPAFGQKDLALSDLQFLIPSIGRTNVEIEGMKVEPSPLWIYPSTKPVHAYIHVYNLTKDDTGKTAFRMQASLQEIGSSGQPIIIKEFEKQGTEQFYPLFLVLDVSKVDPGNYMLVVSVTDRKIIKTIKASRPVRLFRP